MVVKSVFIVISVYKTKIAQIGVQKVLRNFGYKRGEGGVTLFTTSNLRVFKTTGKECFQEAMLIGFFSILIQIYNRDTQRIIEVLGPH